MIVAEDSNKKIYAVKYSNDNISKSEFFEYELSFTKELEYMSRINHPNILRCYDGFFDPESSKYVLVLEYMRGGNLVDQIFKIN